MTPDPASPVVPIETLMEQREWVRWLARSLVADPDRADDLEQQMWLAALEHPPRHARSVRGWLGTVLRRAASKGRRSAWRIDRRERAAAVPDPQPATDEVVAQVEIHGRVVRSVLALEEPYRTTVLLRFFEELPPRRIAERMGVPVDTVNSRLQRALAQLRGQFDQQHGGDRKAWAGAMAALLGSRPADAPPAMPVLATAAIAAALVAVIGGGVWIWASSDRDERREGGRSAADTARATSTSSETEDSAKPSGLSGAPRHVRSEESPSRQADPEEARVPPPSIDVNTFVRVIGPDGGALADAEVSVSAVAGAFRTEGTSGSDGVARFNLEPNAYRVSVWTRDGHHATRNSFLPGNLEMRVGEGANVTALFAEWPEELLRAAMLEARHEPSGGTLRRPAAREVGLGYWEGGLLVLKVESGGAKVTGVQTFLPRSGSVRVTIPSPAEKAIRVSLVDRRTNDIVQNWTWREASLPPMSPIRSLDSRDGFVTLPFGLPSGFVAAIPAARDLLAPTFVAPSSLKSESETSPLYVVEADPGVTLIFPAMRGVETPVELYFLGYIDSSRVQYPRFPQIPGHSAVNLQGAFHPLQFVHRVTLGERQALQVPSEAVIGVRSTSEEHHSYQVVKTGRSGSSQQVTLTYLAVATLEVKAETERSAGRGTVTLVRKSEVGGDETLGTGVLSPDSGSAVFLGIELPAVLTVRLRVGDAVLSKSLELTSPGRTRVMLSDADTLPAEEYSIRVIGPDGAGVAEASVGLFVGSSEAIWRQVSPDGRVTIAASGEVHLVSAWKEGWISAEMPPRSSRSIELRIVPESRVKLRFPTGAGGELRQVHIVRDGRTLRVITAVAAEGAEHEIRQLRAGQYEFSLESADGARLSRQSLVLEPGQVTDVAFQAP